MKRFFAAAWHVLPLFLFAVLGIAFLPDVTFAQSIFGFADSIGKAIGATIAGFALAIPRALLGIASLLLNQAIDPSFIRVPYTTGPIIDSGLVVVRDFANMLIVFFLIIIGLATALRIGQYEAKKTLPKLIGVALLINFTPVITGFIVDTSNIFMNFFLEGVAGVGIIDSVFSGISSTAANDVPSFFKPTEAVGLVFKILVVIIFDIFAALVFFLFAALFIMRRIAIWLLVILSPIAFVAAVLPRTSGLFKMWWNQFFQWSIIGIFAAFFLWLGDQIISVAAQGQLVAPAPPGGGITGFPTSILNDVMPYGIALAMLLAGFFASLQSNAMMSGGAIKLAQEAGQAFKKRQVIARAGAWGRERALGFSPLQGAASALEGVTRGSKPGWGKDKEGEKKTGMFARVQRGAAGTVGLGAKIAPPGMYQVLHATGRVAGTRLIEQERKEEAAVKSKARSMSQGERRAAYRRATSTGEKVGIVNAALDEGDLRNEKDLKSFGITEEALVSLAKKGTRSDIHKSIMRGFSHRAEDIGKPFEEAFGSIKPSDVKLMSEASLKNERVRNRALEKWDGQHLGELAKNFPGNIRDEYQEIFDKKGIDWFNTNNPKIPRYLAGNAAQDVGFRALPESVQVLERALADIQKQLSELRRPGPRGVADLSPENQAKVRELLEEQTRKQEQLARTRSQAQTPPAPPSPPPPEGTPPPTGEGYIGGIGPTRGPRSRRT